MKKALAKKMLNKEIDKLPFTHRELGEDMAVDSLKGKVSAKYDAFKQLGKALAEKNKVIKARMLSAQKAKVTAQKKQLLAKMAAAELRKKLRATVPKKRLSKITQKEKTEARLVQKLKKTLAKRRSGDAKIRKKMRKKIVAMKKRVSDKLRKGMKATQRQLDLGLMKIKDYKKVLHHKWHVDTSIVAKWKHKVRGDVDLVKDLKSQVKQNDRNFKEMRAGLQAKFLANERDLVREDHRKLSKQKGKTKGEKQKEK